MPPAGKVRVRMSRRGYENREDVEVAILDALLERPNAGMSIFALRSRVDYDIETLEPALANLRDDALIKVEYDEERSVIRPADAVIPAPDEPTEPISWLERIRRVLFDR